MNNRDPRNRMLPVSEGVSSGGDICVIDAAVALATLADCAWTAAIVCAMLANVSGVASTAEIVATGCCAAVTDESGVTDTVGTEAVSCCTV